MSKRVKRAHTGSRAADISRRVLSEYPEVERRRYLERIRSEQSAERVLKDAAPRFETNMTETIG